MGMRCFYVYQWVLYYFAVSFHSEEYHLQIIFDLYGGHKVSSHVLRLRLAPCQVRHKKLNTY